LRIKIFKRILIFYKNKNFFLKNKYNNTIFNTLSCLKKNLEKIEIQKNNEIDYCRFLAQIFVLKIGFLKKKRHNKISYMFTPFQKKPDLREKKKYINSTKSVEYILEFLGKTITLEGIVTKIKPKIENTVSFLIECEKCGSIFYFALENLNPTFPFLCCKANCSSKNFFTHFGRTVTENYQSIKLGKISVNFKKLKTNELITLEIYGNLSPPIFLGHRIVCYASLKLYPLPKKKFAIFKKNHLFGVYMQTRKLGWPFYDLILKNKFFLARNDFSIIHQIISSNDIFHLLIKNIEPSSNWNEGFKAFLLLSCSQEINVGKKIQTNDTKFCMVFSKIKTGNDFFIRGLLKFFTKSFFLNCENFKFQFNKMFNGRNLIYKHENFKNTNIMLFIDCREIGYKNQKIKIFISDVKKKIEKNHMNLGKCVVIFYFKSEEKISNRKLLYKEYLNKITDENEINDPIFILKKTSIENLENIELSEFLKYHFKKKEFSEIGSLIKNKHPIKKSVFEKFIYKKKISIGFFKKYLTFVQNFPDPSLSRKSFNYLVQLYQKTKVMNINFTKNSIDFLLPLIKLSQCRAKIDLREKVIFSDILDSIEIYLDSRPKFLKNLCKFLYNCSPNTQKLETINKFLKLLNKFFYRTGQTLFETAQLEKNFKNRIKYSDIEEILKTFKFIKKIKGSLISFNV
jgi:DNA replicative helicase MCM subunit Mcm2 (Cdc46/Mcm family)